MHPKFEFIEETKIRIKSLRRDGASRQSRGVQVTLKFPYCTSVQGAKVEVKSSVCDVEVSCLLNEIDDLENKRFSGESALQQHTGNIKPN